MSTEYSVGQMNQLGDALEAAGFTPQDVTKLRTSPWLKDIKQVLLGFAEIKVVKHLIDLDADPFVPDGWSIEEHQKGGTFEWSPDCVRLYLSQQQNQEGVIGGHDLRKDLVGEPVFNACLLDYLLAHPHLIPEAWKRRFLYFWGTIYRDSKGNLGVRFLYWNGSSWQWSGGWLDHVWNRGDRTALRVS